MSVRVVVPVMAVVVAATLGLVTGSPASAATCTGSLEDVNGDDYPDVVVGDPRADVGGAAAGSVQVRYRAGSGWETARFDQSDVGEQPEAGDRFGATVVLGNVDSDTCADLVISAPGEDVDGHSNAGVVHVIFGSAGGAGGGRTPLTLRPGSVGLPGTPETGGSFGAAVSVAEPTDGGIGVLAIGSPGSDEDRGAVWLVLVDAAGDVTGAETVSVTTPGVPGSGADAERFGSALGFGYLVNGSRGGLIADLLVGAPDADRGAGRAVVIADAGAGAPYTTQVWTQDSSGVDDSSEPGDAFGSTVYAGRNFITGFRLVAIGAPREDIGDVKDAGKVHLFRFGSTMKANDETGISQNTPGVADRAEAGDRFGTSVRVDAYFTQVTAFGLVVGVPHEDVGRIKDAGAVALIPAESDPGASDVRITQDTAGVPGRAERDERFGTSALGRYGLTVGVPGDRASTSGLVLDLPWEFVFYGTTKGIQQWSPSVGSDYGSSLG